MFPFTNKEAEPITHKLVEGRKDRIRGYSFRTQKPVNRRCRFQHLELSSRIGPLVAICRREEDRAWRAECQETILIERKAVGTFVELFEFTVEPVRKAIVDCFDRLTGLSSARRAAAAAGLMRKGHGNSFIKRSGE